MKKVDLVSIYRLIDPITVKVRYIGVTSQTIQGRLDDHLKNARQGAKYHISCWIRSLTDKNLTPRTELIEVVKFDVWAAREKYWIKFYRQMGSDLTNCTDGGDGLLNPSESVRKRISEGAQRPMTEETKQKLREINTGRTVSQETRDKIVKTLTGRKHTKERCKNMSIGRSGIPHTEETKQKIRKTMGTPEARAFFGAFRRGTKLSEAHKAVFRRTKKETKA